MTVVQSLGSIADIQPSWLPARMYGSVSLYSDYTADYATIYRTQPNVRTVVDFIARNVAQLGLHVFRRVSDTDRERLTDHGLARTIKRPNPFTSRYRLIQSLLTDLGIFDRAFWLKVKATGGGIALLRVPPQFVTIEGGLMPTRFTVSVGGEPLELDPEQVVYFRDHNPDSSLGGLSPLETLRRVLAEEAAAGDYREHFWRNAARMGGIVERPATAPPWSDPARARFMAEFEALYSGPSNSGKTAVLEDGMAWKAQTFSARDSEYLAGRQLTREECARAYHVPLPMVGLLEHATYSNVSEMHKMLYQDCLAPWLVMVEEDIALQLLPEYPDSDDVYVEFNIAEKLKGSFEEQASAMSTLIGRPVMTANEGRARLNLPRLEGDADELVTPLNVLVGGQPSPQTPALPPANSEPKAIDSAELKRNIDATYITLRERHVAIWDRALGNFFERQASATIGKLKSRKAAADDIFRPEDWNARLRQRLLALNIETAGVFGGRVADSLGFDEWDPDEMSPFFDANARIAAEGINATTRDQLARALEADDPPSAVRKVFDLLVGVRAAQIAQSKVTTAANFGSHRAAERGGAAEKTWQVNSGNPRSQHAAVDGQTVGLGETFGNGMRWPGDSEEGDAGQLANCQCSVQFSIRRR